MAVYTYTLHQFSSTADNEAMDTTTLTQSKVNANEKLTCLLTPEGVQVMIKVLQLLQRLVRQQPLSQTPLCAQPVGNATISS
jgi:hypothetical protein